MDNKEVFEKGLLALKPFLFALQEALHDKLFDTELGQRARQLNKDAKHVPGIVVGLVGSVLSVLDSKGLLSSFAKDLGTDSTALIMRRLQKEDVPTEIVKRAEVLLTVDVEVTKQLLEWAQTMDSKSRQQFFNILSELNEEQVNKLLSLESDARQRFWDVIKPSKSHTTDSGFPDQKKHVDQFFQKFHVDAERLQKRLKERIEEERKRRGHKKRE